MTLDNWRADDWNVRDMGVVASKGSNTPRVLLSKGARCRRKMASEVTQVAMGVGANLGCVEHRFIAYRALADA